ncbi:hypothetical protein [Candidatus Pelagibacter sp. HIMB1611]|uniref:hypothetical protein n=1 Tax=Candidatus Pelagibacter sp. HIMB1611 TaxID=3413357 RepID=UPI003F83C7D1
MYLLLNYYLGIIVIFTSVYGYGKIFSKNNDDFFIFLCGYLFLGIVAIIIHFFIAINIWISSVILILGICLFVYKLKIRNFLFQVPLILSFATLLIGFTDHPIDANLYHHSYVSYLKQEKIIFGIADIHSRFGHISFLQFVQSITTNDFLTIYSISNLNILFYYLFIIFCAKLIFRKNTNNFVLVLTTLISSFILIKLARYREFGNDLIPLLVASYFLIKIFIINLNKEIYKNNKLIKYSPIFFFMMLSHKITYVFSTFLFASNLNNKIIFGYFKNYKNLLILISSIIFISLWLVKNIFETSCLIYPIIQTCFENTKWALSGHASPEFAMINAEAWAKGWIDKPDNYEISMENYNVSFNWLKVWFGKHFLKIIEIISPLLLIIILINIMIRNASEIITDKELFKEIKIFLFKIFILNFVGLAFWFLNAPIFRYGSFYIIILIVNLYLIYDFKKIYNISEKIKSKFKFIFAISLIVFFLKNIDRQINSKNTFFPITKPSIFEYEKIIFNEINFLKPKNNINICFYTDYICSHMITKSFNVEKLGKYFLIKN